MSELAEPIGLGGREQAILDRLVSARVRVNWQVAAYAALMVAGAGMRFWDLGSRALHHDESLHAWTAWKLFEGQGYAHEAWMHGPFQFFGTAFVFFLFGVGDYTSRILPAVFGSAMVALPFFLRHRLGTVGALLLSAAIAFSPTLLYYSRFARNDIYIAFFTLALVISLWRYIDEQRPRFLYLGALILGLSFATKESTFINGAVLIAFLNIWMAVHFWRQIRDHNKPDLFTSINAFILLLPLAWAVAALWPFTGRLRQRLGLDRWHPAGDFLILLGTLMLPQFAAAVQVPLSGLGIGEGDLARSGLFGASRENLLGFFTILALIAATGFIGLRWNARVWALAAAAFYLPYAVLYTSFFTNLDGFYSGQWGALDYWLSQQEVARGEQPWFYYLMLLPAYEFLPLAFAAPALIWYAFKGNVFCRFLVFWAAATMVGYSYAGEKMPWLSVNTSLPIIVLGAFALGQVITSGAPRKATRLLEPYARPLMAAALGLAAMALAVFGPPGALWVVLRVLLVIAALLGIVWLLLPDDYREVIADALGLGSQRRRRRRSESTARYAVVGVSALAGALLAFSLVVGARASYQYGDVPRELLIYTQTSPFVPDIIEGIDAAARNSGLDEDLPIIIENGIEPWVWYLRDYKQVRYSGVGSDPPQDAVIVVLAENEQTVQPHLDRYGPPVRFPLRWWFPEFDTYKTLPTSDVYRAIKLDSVPRFANHFIESLFRTGTWENWWDYMRHRKPPMEAATPEDTLGRMNMIAYFPKRYQIDITGAVPLPPTPVDTTPIPQPTLPPAQQLAVDLVLGQEGSPAGPLKEPSGLALDSQRNLYVADTFNHRILKFDQDGNFLSQVGSNGSGDGQFNEPWGVAVDAQGNVYVADTFNHRIQKFDPSLKFIRSFGVAATSLDNPEPEAFWGPRDLAVDPQGNVWVVDTGTGRVVKYGPDGTLIQPFGAAGTGQGQFKEATAIEVAPTGDIFVADSGNRRVQRFDAAFKFLAQYEVPGWLFVDSVAKPYLALLPDGGLVVSDPTQHKLFRLDASGAAVATLDPEGAALALPRGVVFDDRGFLYVVEAEPDQVRRLTLDVAAPP